MKFRHNRPTRRVIADTEVAQGAEDLLFETNDVAQLVAEITGEDVEVTVDEDMVTFDVGDASYQVSPDVDSERVESAKALRSKMRRVGASYKPRRTPMAAKQRRFTR